MNSQVFVTSTAEETMALGETFGKSLPDNSVVCFFGDLAAGKTTFIKGLASGAARCDEDEVNSPTFVYLNIYQGGKVIYHFDLYRLERHEQFLGLGFDEYMGAGGIACIEWSERIEPLIPKDAIRVELSHMEGGRRRIAITPWRAHE